MKTNNQSILFIDSLSDIQSTAKVFLEQFEQASVVAFLGDMGAGKTTFIKALCKELGVVDTVNSPTFAIINEYETEQKERIYHFDLYRLEQSEDVLEIGFEDYIYSGNWCFIEWPEIAKAYLPENTVQIKIEEIEKGKRKLTFME